MPPPLSSLTQQLRDRQDLTTPQVLEAVSALVEESVPVADKAEFLAALAGKGETTQEIADFARTLRELSLAPPLDAATRSREILDVCGTGGDRLNTFNISTTVAIVAAAAGITVAKHGNRAITSQSGSADVLEALGIRIDLPPPAAAAMLRDRGFAFLFAPNYHPAFRHLGPARRLCAERGQRTIFNFLGPLLNPARPSAQLIGVPRPDLCQPMAQVLQSLGVRRGLVVSGQVPLPSASGNAHLDEFSTLGPTTLAEFYQDRGFATSTLDPGHFPLQTARLEDLVGGNRDANAAMVRGILEGRDRGPRRDAVLLNAAAALLVAGHSRSLAEGWDAAGALIDGGQAAAKLADLAKS
ncbi:MAG: anthranilate phosphoribosyltransferase [Verrucomicrobiota bacterium]|jgi:anthranilate phosphoribosyltransferase